LYVSDLDRTLLRSDGSLSAASARLLNAAIDGGALFTYATARSFLSSRRATKALRLRLPLLTYGGTITADPDTGQPADLRLLGATTVQATLRLCDAHATAEPIMHTFEDGRDWIRWRPERMTLGVQTFLASRSNDPRLRPATADDPLDAASVFYISILAQNPELTGLRTALIPELGSAAHFLSVDPGTPGLDWLEFHHEDGTKAKAIQRLASTLDADRLVVFGDNHNDLPMFAIADESYAVSNAVPAVRDAATRVINSNDEDAVARWITADRQTSSRT
jgi:Cof subfamily protein (haloacid dehalogenase superfamily)